MSIIFKIQEFLDHVFLRHPWLSVDRYTLNQYSWAILDWQSIAALSTPWLTLDPHLINISVDSQLGWSTNFQLMHMSQLTFSRLLTGSWSSVNQVGTEYRSGCWSIINWDVDQGYQSILWIERIDQHLITSSKFQNF